MKQILQQVRTGELEIAEVPYPALKRGGVIVHNVASLVSAGTEKMLVEFAGKSLVGKARERPDLVRQVLTKMRKDGITPTVKAVLARLDQPLPLGYSCAGVVAEVAADVTEFKAGDRVACAGMGYASHAEVVFVPRNLVVPIPDAVSFDDAAYVTLGAIALQGVRIAETRLGERVGVIGLGLLGQLTVQLLKAAGAIVIGVDVDPARVQQARNLGADVALVRSDDVEGAVQMLTNGVGLDAIIITAATDSNDPVELAGQISRLRGRVVMVGAVKMDVPRKPFYEKELELRLSRSYGPGRYDPQYEERGIDYPIGYVRWTERRNMEEFLRLVASGAVTPAELTTHRFPVESATDAYTLLSEPPKEMLGGMLLTYPSQPDTPKRHVAMPQNAPRRDGAVGIGLIGAGNFARGVLLPEMRKLAVKPVGVSTASGASGRATAGKFGFGYCTTDAEQIFHDAEVEAVVIATPHSSHASLAARALRAGKAVFVEKPLAINVEGLRDAIAAQQETGLPLTVGFNRRFSPLAAELKKALGEGPLAITYRVNAGAIPATHWIQDPAEGGGRIVGEVCHFIDLIHYLTDDLTAEVSAQAIGSAHDTVCISLRTQRGSIATINYFANGDALLPKERIEVFANGRAGVLDDFRRLDLYVGNRHKRVGGRGQQKGFAQEISAFLDAVRGRAGPPIPMEQLAVTTLATFAIEQSLRSNAPVSLSELNAAV